MIPASSHGPSYSFRWAESVVSRLTQKYPRATGFLTEFAKIEPRHLAYYLAVDQKVYVQLREAIHWLDRAAPGCAGGPTDGLDPKQLLSDLVRSRGRLMPERMKTYLTARISEL